MTRAGTAAGLSESDSRCMAAGVVAGAAALVSDTELSFEEITSLTLMQTVDEELVGRLMYEAALTVVRVVGSNEGDDGYQGRQGFTTDGPCTASGARTAEIPAAVSLRRAAFARALRARRKTADSREEVGELLRKDDLGRSKTMVVTSRDEQ